MKRIIRYLAIAVGVVSMFAVAAFVALYFLGEHVISSRRAACQASEDFVAVQSSLHKAFADGTIDKPVVDRENKRIEDALEQCAMGDGKRARAMLMGVMLDAALSSDAAYARKLNKGQRK